MTIKDMLNAGIQFCKGDGVIIRTFDEKRDEMFDLAYTDCLSDGLSSLSSGEHYVNARIKAIYLEDGRMRLVRLSGNKRKTLGMPENTGFLGGVVANWLQKSVINLLSE